MDMPPISMLSLFFFATDISPSDAVLLLKLCAMQRLAVVWLLSFSAFGQAQERERESVEAVKNTGYRKRAISIGNLIISQWI